MDWLDTPTSHDPPPWDLSPVNNFTFDSDYDYYMNDLDEFLNPEPKAYVISADSDNHINLGDVLSSSVHSSSVCSPCFFPCVFTYQMVQDAESDSSTQMSRQNSNRSSSAQYTNLETVSFTTNLFNPDQILATTETDTIPSPSPSAPERSTISHIPSNRHQQRKHPTTISSPADSNEAHLQRSKKMKLAHNIIEKRYRMNMNSKFIALSNALPTNSSAATCNSNSTRGNAGSTGEQHPPNKSEVLANALTYIRQLEAQTTSLRKEVAVLKENLLPRSSTMTAPQRQKRRTMDGMS